MQRLWPCVFVVLLAAELRAETYIFKWVDRQGTVHITDRLGDVPEPYRSLYAEEVRRREEQRDRAGQVNEPPAAPAPTTEAAEPRGESLADKIGKERARWKQLVADWRKRLKEATDALDAIDGEIAETRANPLLRHTPQVKEQVAALEAKRARLFANVERAREMLLNEIPAKAKKEKVPPKWLE